MQAEVKMSALWEFGGQKKGLFASDVGVADGSLD